MKLEIKLENYKYCDKCPCLIAEYYNCECKYQRTFMDSLHENKSYAYNPKHIKNRGYFRQYRRPMTCIKDNGQ